MKPVGGPLLGLLPAVEAVFELSDVEFFSQLAHLRAGPGAQAAQEGGAE